MTRFTLTVLLALVFCSSASAAFSVGIAEPGVGAIPSNDVYSLGLSSERRTVQWHGETSFTGTITWTPGLRQFVVVSSGYPAAIVPTTSAQRQIFCGFVVSFLKRYPTVHDVIVWNEPNLAEFWGAGADQYAQLLAACSPQIRGAGARVWAPGMSPSTTAGVADFAHKIAARGKHLIDGWDQHDYSDYSLAEKIAAVRAAFGWKVPLLVSESGGTASSAPGYLVRKAYCAGAIGWLNFKLRDNGNWKTTGVRNADGSRKPSYGVLAAEATKIRTGKETCSGSPAPPAPHSNPPPPPRVRHAFKSHWRKVWYCPEARDGTPVTGRFICVLQRERNR